MSIVTEYLADHEIEFFAYDHARTETALEEARTLGVGAGRVAKTLVLDTSAGHVLAVIPANRRLDMRLAGQATGDPHTTLAAESEISHDFPGYDLGTIPPLAGLLGMPVYVDQELTGHESVLFASGRQTESVKMHISDLLAYHDVMIAPLCEPRESFDRDWMESR